MSQLRKSVESFIRRLRSKGRSPSLKPRCEQLEDRTVPANSFFNLPGTPDQFVTVRFNWVTRESDFNNEIGVYAVDDAQGTVNGVAPGTPGYTRAVLRDDSRQVLFDSSTGPGNRRNLSFAGGSRLAFYLIQGTTSSTFLARNPTNQPGTGVNALFSVDAANPDGLDHVARDKESGPGEFRWEDQMGLGDRDYNDVIFRARVIGTDEQPRPPGFGGRALLTPGTTGETIRSTFRLMRRGDVGEIGLFQVDDANGRIGNFLPGDAGYLRTALAQDRRRVIFTVGQQPGGTRSLDLPGGSFFGLYLIDQGSAAGFLAANPQNAPGKNPNAIVSFLGANPDQRDHLRQMFDRTVGFESDIGSDNPDFQDAVIHFNFGNRGDTTPTVPIGDTTGPILAARLINDDGVPNDGISSDPAILGTVTDLGGVASLRAGFGAAANSDVTDLVQADGSFQINLNRLRTINGGTLPDGVYRLRLEGTDRAGNTSFFDVNFTFQAVPNTLGISAQLANDLGLPNDGISSDPTISGTVDFADLATLRAGFGATATVDITDVVLPNGTFQIPLARLQTINGGTLPEGSYRLRLEGIDQAGFSSFFDVFFNFQQNPNTVGAIANQSVGIDATVSLNLFGNFTGPALANTRVQFDYEAPFGDVNVELFDVNAPQGGRTTPGTVQNFLDYLNAGRYQNTVIHRIPQTAGQDFVVQGGGFVTTQNPADPLDPVTTFPAIMDEVGNSNVNGTIAMAKSGPNTATSQYFFNVQDNTFLDNPNNAGGFTAFGRVLSGQDVLTNDIAAVDRFFIDGISINADTPPQTFPLQGNVPAGTTTLTGLTEQNFVVLGDVIVTQRRDQLQFTASSNNEAVATVLVDPQRPNFLLITGHAAGQVTITVTATGPSGTVQTTFQVTVP